MRCVTVLIRPDLDRYEEWAAMLEEYADGRPNGSGLWDTPGGPSRETFAAHLEVSARLADDTSVLAEDRVHADQYWIADGGDLVGFLQFRRSLNDDLLEMGGHVGYSVRPSR